jgi:hypothetical protein
MIRNKVNFKELMEGMGAEFRRQKMGYSTQLNNLYFCQKIIQMHEERGLESLDSAFIAEFIQREQERYERGDLTERKYTPLARNARRLIEFNESGTFSTISPSAGSTYKLNAAFEKIADAYLSSLTDVSANTLTDARWIAHKYFAWLMEQGHEDLSSVDSMIMQKFIVHCSKTMSATAMYDVQLRISSKRWI